MRSFALLLLFIPAAFSQNFDVASVKVAPPLTNMGGISTFAGRAGGPGSTDPGRIRYARITMKNLLTKLTA